MSIAIVEALESRQLLSAAPILTGVTLVGPVKDINSIVLTFSAPLDPVTSQSVLGYTFGKPHVGASSDGFDYLSLLGYRETKHETAAIRRAKAVKHGKIQFSSAVYNAANNTVTLTPVAPFKAQQFFRVLRVRGAGVDAINDASGIPFNGGVDLLTSWKMHQGKAVRYTDAQGDKVTLKLRGHGKLYVFAHRSGDPNPNIFIDGANASTIVTGTVLQGGHFSGVTNIAEVEGGAGSNNGLLNNPSFKIQAIEP